MAPALRGRSSAVPIHGDERGDDHCDDHCDDHTVASEPAITAAAAEGGPGGTTSRPAPSRPQASSGEASDGNRAQAASSRKPAPEEKLVANLIALLEAGTTPWRREWDGLTGDHHRNLLSGRRYSGANPALLSLAQHLRGSALPYWCGFAEAKALGLFPRKGSKAVHVLRPQVQGRSDGHPQAEHQSQNRQNRDRQNRDRQGRDRQEPRNVSALLPGDRQRADETSAEGHRWVRYRPVPVFNAADLEGEALEGLIRMRRQAETERRRPEPERLAAAEAVLRGWPVPVSFGGDRACYLPQPDRIVLPERSAFHSTAALYATWAHEAIHSTGHSNRLARDLSGGMGAGGDGGRAYAREELVAELGAVLLGDRLEIGAAMANHAAYLDHWIGLLQETPRLLFQVLGEARRAAELICPEQHPAGEA
jgi:antirestriction protein ArdC